MVICDQTMPIHVAILKPPFDRLILEGTKRIESRFTATAREPFGCCVPGQTIYFKRSAGPFFAVAQIARLLLVDQVTPKIMDELADRYNQWIGAPADYWAAKRQTTRYATLIWLRDVRPTTLGPRYAVQSMRAWYVLDDAAAPNEAAARLASEPAFTVQLTDGAVRQNHVRLGDAIAHLPQSCLGGRRREEQGALLTIDLEDGPAIQTDVVAERRMFRSRRWGAWFKAQKLRGGDELAFYRVGPRAYRVVPVRGLR